MSLAILVLGTAVGIAVPQVYHVTHWPTAVVLLALLAFAIGEGAYLVWRETDRERVRTLALVEAKTTEIAATPSATTLIGGTGGDGYNAGGGGGVAGPGGYAEGGKGGAGHSLLEAIAFAALGSGLPLDYFVGLHGYSSDSPELRKRFGTGGIGGGAGGGGGTVVETNRIGSPDAKRL